MVAIDMGVAKAVPAFARKYEANCALCHTNEPRLTPFGQQFKENGYQMPGSADGGTQAKHVYEGAQGSVVVDDISKIMAVRIRADIQRPTFKQETDEMKNDGVREQVDFEVPKIVNLFFAGTARENLSYFLEAEYNTQEEGSGVAFERAFLVFSNLGKPGVANVQVGTFDPSGLYAFPTHRQQLNPIGPKAETDSFPPTINQIPLLPLAFSSKMFGLTKGSAYGPSSSQLTDSNGDTVAITSAGDEGYAILPFEPLLYNAPNQTGIAIHGRPGGFGSGFLYQLGMAVNDKVNTDGTKENRYDTYVMGRYDFMVGAASSQVSAFYYNAPDAAISTLNMGGTIVYADQATDITRWGIGARAQWGDWDVYGTYIADSIDAPTWGGNMMAANSVWETDGAGFSAEADWRMNPNWMLGLRYDWMAPGGLEKLPMGSSEPLNVDASFLAPIVKYYPNPNIGLYARAHFNLESDKKTPIGGGVDEHPATNLENMLAFGVDMAF
ncbi:hypothetical protein Tel_03480 [Candidatus Tenderia electrophaga]|jgi:hypothetical protein|uniref:Uncharacterized protein n=1 Tax=Candidatus Tenderia electrophaga TaxID=1748243 RepID=A0A0S2TAW6_9GAMM|nr:hypothetical protein Tel_03480 [Candidatus Tenderia electrophaga]